MSVRVFVQWVIDFSFGRGFSASARCNPCYPARAGGQGAWADRGEGNHPACTTPGRKVGDTPRNGEALPWRRAGGRSPKSVVSSEVEKENPEFQCRRPRPTHRHAASRRESAILNAMEHAFKERREVGAMSPIEAELSTRPSPPTSAAHRNLTARLRAFYLSRSRVLELFGMSNLPADLVHALRSDDGATSSALLSRAV